MEITNRGYINFNGDYNRKEANYCTASMSFYNGKDENGQYKNGYIGVVAFGELGDILYNNSGNLVAVSGYFRQNEKDGNKYPQVVITAINGYAPQKNEIWGNNQQSSSQKQGNYNQGGNNQGYQQQQTPNFGRSNPMDISDDDLPF